MRIAHRHGCDQSQAAHETLCLDSARKRMREAAAARLSTAAGETTAAPSSSLQRAVRPLCDGCGKAIKHENSEDDYLRLLPEYRRGGGCVTDMAWTPELDREHSFHDMRCLCEWASKQRSIYTGKPYWPNDKSSDKAAAKNL